MDRTIIAPWKAEEKELSEKLYKKLLGLNLLHPPTEEFRKCLNEDMFLKPNQQAFFQVMHYLFKLLDPIEFKKRFYWPITDKKAEANFRSSTVEYLKHLNEKHQLHWTNIKSYLVVMPGGMKFINFLLDFVSFVVQEQIKQREKLLSTDIESGEVSDLNIKRMLKQNEFFKDYASAYISDADGQIGKLKEKTETIRFEIGKMAKASKLDVTLLMDDTFLREFEANNKQLYIEKFCKPSENICSLEKPLNDLKQVIDTFQNKESESKFDREAVRRSLVKIQKWFPDSLIADEDTYATPYDEAISTESLISAFNCICPIIEEELSAADQIPLPSNFVSNELSALKAELQQIEEQITDFQKKLNSQMKKRSIEKKTFQATPLRGISGGVISHCSTENTLLMKCVATPPIKLEIQEGSRNSNTRLPFLDDLTLGTDRSEAAGIKAGMESLNNLLAVPRSARKNKNADLSIDLNNTANKSKIIDSMQLLRTINKDTTKPRTITQDLSALGSKWKDRQCLFGKDIDSTPAKTKNESVNIETYSMNITSDGLQKQKLSNTTLVSSPYTPFSSQNERTRIARSQLLDTSGGGNVLFSKKLSAVKKVQDASLNFHNLSTSPSGRLDPLVTFEAKEVPKLLLNDLTLGEEVILPEGGAVTSDKKANSFANYSFDELENDENDINRSNSDIKFIFNLNRHEDDDQLFNISDSVLKDVIM